MLSGPLLEEINAAQVSVQCGLPNPQGSKLQIGRQGPAIQT